jgi:hypothetical protein
MTAPYFIIEHPRQGVLVDLEETESGNVGHFSWSGSRAGEDVMRFTSILSAANARCSITPLKRQSECKVRSSVPEPSGGPMGPLDWPVVA